MYSVLSVILFCALDLSWKSVTYVVFDIFRSLSLLSFKKYIQSYCYYVCVITNSKLIVKSCVSELYPRVSSAHKYGISFALMLINEKNILIWQKGPNHTTHHLVDIVWDIKLQFSPAFDPKWYADEGTEYNKWYMSLDYGYNMSLFNVKIKSRSFGLSRITNWLNKTFCLIFIISILFDSLLLWAENWDN